MMDLGLIDSLDGRICIGVGGQQDAARLRVEVDRLADELHTVHFRHALVREEQSHSFISLLQTVQGLQGARTGIGAHDAIFLGIAFAKIALHGPQDFCVIVDGHQYWFRHWSLLFQGLLVYRDYAMSTRVYSPLDARPRLRSRTSSGGRLYS